VCAVGSRLSGRRNKRHKSREQFVNDVRAVLTSVADTATTVHDALAAPSGENSATRVSPAVPTKFAPRITSTVPFVLCQ